jgi:O-antigen/teichoic acid export membrane protein
LATRATWSLASQAISSASSFLLTVAVLHEASISQFAVFSICFTTYLLVLQLSRSVFGLPILILYSHQDAGGDETAVTESRKAAGGSVVLGLAAAMALLIAAGIVDAEPGQYATMGMVVPFLLYQDAVRHFAFARARPQMAVASDGLWLGLQLVGSVAALVTGNDSPVVLAGIWGVSGAVAGVAAGLKLSYLPLIAGAPAWLRSNASLCRKLLTEFAANSGSYYALLYGLAFVAGLDALGALRAAHTFIGPVIVLLLGANSLGVPEGVRMKDDPSALLRFTSLIATALAAASLVWGVTIYYTLPWLGPRLFTETWATARPLIPLLSLFAAGVGVAVGLTSGLRAFSLHGWIMKSRAAASGLVLLIGLPGAILLDAHGALVGLLAGEWLFCFLAAFRLHRAFRTAGKG